MEKFWKVFKIVVACLVLACLVGCVVMYAIDKTLLKRILDVVVDYANRPLPIIGVSSIVLCALAWKIFQATAYGRNALLKMKREYDLQKEELKNEYSERKAVYTSIIVSYEKEIDVMLECIHKVCDAVPNMKMKEIASDLDAKISSIKIELRESFGKIADADSDVLLQSKEEIVKSVIETVKKELVEKYGEECKKALECIPEAKKI